MAINVVELIQEPDADCAFDQPCKFGHRVEGHAVYCHNDAWEDSPRKCCRTWYSGGKTRDEDCPGFQPNPDFNGEVQASAISGPRCSKCGGTKLMPTDRNRMETCPHCCGDGTEPQVVELSEYERDTISLGTLCSGRKSGGYEYYARIAETKTESDSISRLAFDLGLIDFRSMTGTKAGAMVYLIRLTGKGDAVLHAIWEAERALRGKR